MWTPTRRNSSDLGHAPAGNTESHISTGVRKIPGVIVRSKFKWRGFSWWNKLDLSAAGLSSQVQYLSLKEANAVI
jgi:hypothetical protein